MFDIALSYSSDNRKYVNIVYKKLKQKGLSVFYDQDREISINLVGSHLPEEFDNVFRGGAHISVLFFSKSYLEKKWPKFELHRAKLGLLEATLANASCIVIPVTIDLSFDELPNWIQPFGGLSTNSMNPNTLAHTIYKKFESEFGLSKNFKQNILTHFSCQRYNVVIKQLENKIHNTTINIINDDDLQWSNYLLACAFSRLAESEESKAIKDNFHDKSLHYILIWFENIKKKEPKKLTSSINYFNRDNDLLSLRKNRDRDLPDYIGTPVYVPSSYRTECICLESMVHTPNGIVLARTLKINSKVISMIVEDGKCIKTTIGEICELKIFKERYGILINNKLKCSKNQLIYTTEGIYYPASELQIGQEILSFKGESSKITSLKYLSTPFDVLHIATKDEPHNYIAQNILCHNES